MRRLLLIAMVAGGACAAGAATPPERPCSAPCFQAARSEFRTCLSDAQGVSRDTLDGCLERDHTCVDACREQRQDCRDGTGVGVELVACDLSLAAEKARCRNTFPPGSIRRERCISQAQVEHFRCRRTVRQSFRRALRECRDAFTQCAAACGPGAPPGGAGTCRADTKAALEEDLASCKLPFQVTASACFNRDVSCVQDCADARAACSAPTQATLVTALAACTAAQAAAVAACVAANPGGGSALEQCITTAQADAFDCREAALKAAAPGFAACAAPYVSCVRACPPA